MAKAAAAWVYDFLKVFTWDMSFRKNRIIGNYWLNLLGLHALRFLISHGLFRFRLLLLSPLLDAGQRRQFREDGFLRMDNFLPPEDFAALKQEATAYHGRVHEVLEGGTITQRLYLTEEVLEDLPACRALTRHEALLRRLRYASSKNRIPLFYLENIIHHQNNDGAGDPQKDLHRDTFFPCVKAWLYLDPVEARNGPFTMVPGSHRLTWKRLCWEYRQSLIASRREQQADPQRYWDGSFRFAERDLASLGYDRPVAMQVPANTLIIANVHAAHCRGDGAAGASRLTVWMQARDNPFNPVFSPFPQATARLFERIWKSHMARRTEREVARGAWRLADGGFSRRDP